MAKRRSITKRAFTLIELLVVLGVIGVIASFLLVSLSGSGAKARDRRRIADLKLIQVALELYAKGEGEASYPYPITIYNDPTFQKYLTKTPNDPHDTQYTYYAPACLKPASPPAAPLALIVERNAGTQRELIGRDGSPASYCPPGFGFVPYALAADLETASSATDLITSIVMTSPTQLILSTRPPLY